MKVRLIILLFSLMTFSAFSQDNRLTVNVSHDSLLLGNQCTVSFHLHNLDGQLPEPLFQNCNVSGPNVSSQYQNINGEISQKISATYYLTPIEEGVFIIPSITVKTEEEILNTQEIKILVLPNPKGIIEQQNSDSFFFDWSSPKREKQPIKSKTTSKRKSRKI